MSHKLGIQFGPNFFDVFVFFRKNWFIIIIGGVLFSLINIIFRFSFDEGFSVDLDIQNIEISISEDNENFRNVLYKYNNHARAVTSEFSRIIDFSQLEIDVSQIEIDEDLFIEKAMTVISSSMANPSEFVFDLESSEASTNFDEIRSLLTDHSKFRVTSAFIRSDGVISMGLNVPSRVAQIDGAMLQYIYLGLSNIRHGFFDLVEEELNGNLESVNEYLDILSLRIRLLEREQQEVEQGSVVLPLAILDTMDLSFYSNSLYNCNNGTIDCEGYVYLPWVGFINPNVTLAGQDYVSEIDKRIFELRRLKEALEYLEDLNQTYLDSLNPPVSYISNESDMYPDLVLAFEEKKLTSNIIVSTFSAFFVGIILMSILAFLFQSQRSRLSER